MASFPNTPQDWLAFHGKLSEYFPQGSPSHLAFPPKVLNQIFEYLEPGPILIGTKPNELSLRIQEKSDAVKDFLCRRRTLHAACRTTKQLKVVAQPLLYRSIVLVRAEQLVTLFVTLWNNPHLCGKIKYLACLLDLADLDVILDTIIAWKQGCPKPVEPHETTGSDNNYKMAIVLGTSRRDIFYTLGLELRSPRLEPRELIKQHEDPKACQDSEEAASGSVAMDEEPKDTRKCLPQQLFGAILALSDNVQDLLLTLPDWKEESPYTIVDSVLRWIVVPREETQPFPDDPPGKKKTKEEQEEKKKKEEEEEEKKMMMEKKERYPSKDPLHECVDLSREDAQPGFFKYLVTIRLQPRHGPNGYVSKPDFWFPYRPTHVATAQLPYTKQLILFKDCGDWRHLDSPYHIPGKATELNVEEPPKAIYQTKPKEIRGGWLAGFAKDLKRIEDLRLLESHTHPYDVYWLLRLAINLKTFHWTYDPRDWTHRAPKQNIHRTGKLVSDFKRQPKDGAIEKALMEGAPRLVTLYIDRLRDRGFNLQDTIDCFQRFDHLKNLTIDSRTLFGKPPYRYMHKWVRSLPSTLVSLVIIERWPQHVIDRSLVMSLVMFDRWPQHVIDRSRDTFGEFMLLDDWIARALNGLTDGLDNLRSVTYKASPTGASNYGSPLRSDRAIAKMEDVFLRSGIEYSFELQ
ncbi:Uu.00g132060.m01.CDS01 [Anthostomella pinea]|uniref:Uu.00g132060.m01.CDS01 n=1 Tax=Anthostomella pinea TaxID=933095 RepID=A0AAI8VDP8_9PEZI|nr:Uu.00g132060.m01.CDS01 [Anthostomella pinea]